jgi:hypothetical protein
MKVFEKDIFFVKSFSGFIHSRRENRIFQDVDYHGASLSMTLLKPRPSGWETMEGFILKERYV